jgi:coenzyme F420 hydrogenase subunit beta
MKAVETVLHLRRSAPRKLRHMTPAHVWDLVKGYGLTPSDEERPVQKRDRTKP